MNNNQHHTKFRDHAASSSTLTSHKIYIVGVLLALSGIASFFLSHTSAQVREKNDRKPSQAKTVLINSINSPAAAIMVSDLSTQTPTQLVQRIIGNSTPF